MKSSKQINPSYNITLDKSYLCKARQNFSLTSMTPISSSRPTIDSIAPLTSSNQKGLIDGADRVKKTLKNNRILVQGRQSFVSPSRINKLSFVSKEEEFNKTSVTPMTV